MLLWFAKVKTKVVHREFNMKTTWYLIIMQQHKPSDYFHLSVCSPMLKWTQGVFVIPGGARLEGSFLFCPVNNPHKPKILCLTSWVFSRLLLSWVKLTKVLVQIWDKVQGPDSYWISQVDSDICPIQSDQICVCIYKQFMYINNAFLNNLCI